MVDAVKESTRKVKMQEQRMVQMEDRAEGIDRQLDFVEETRRLADKTRADTDDVLPRLITAEANVSDLFEKVAEAQARADEAHEVGACTVCAVHASSARLHANVLSCGSMRGLRPKNLVNSRGALSCTHCIVWQRANGLKEELDYERDERVRIEDEHTESVTLVYSCRARALMPSPQKQTSQRFLFHLCTLGAPG